MTGRLFTAKNVCDLAVKAAGAVGITAHEAQVSIVGAAGSIGSASAQIMANRGFTNLNLIDLSGKGERMKQLRVFIHEIDPQAEVSLSNSIDSVKKSDIILVATNRVDAFLKGHHLKAGAIVVDDAKPVNVDRALVKEREDILILEGGVVATESIDVHVNMGLQHKTDIYSCLAEVVALASEGHNAHYNLGETLRVDFTELHRLDSLAETLRFRTGDFQNERKVYHQVDIDKVRLART